MKKHLASTLAVLSALALGSAATAPMAMAETAPAAATASTATTYTVTGASWLTLRTGPGVGYAKVRAVPKGYVITNATVLSNGWVRFTDNGRTVYTALRYLTAGATSPQPTTVVRHVRQKTDDLFVDVYDRKAASSSYDVHYLPRGGMVKGVVEGSWFHMPGGKYVPMAELTTTHTRYTGTNGRHHPSTLCNVQGTTVASHVLTACGAIGDLKGLNLAYKARFNEDLPWDECYRTYDTQVAYRQAFGPKAAVPGYSNHGSTTRPACDAPEDPRRFGFGTTRYTWLVQNGPRYGWVHPGWAKPWGTNPEYWHFEHVG